MEKYNPNDMILINVDVQRGFTPATDTYPATEGYGQLPVDGTHEIVPTINKVNMWAKQNGIERVTTQDWHPKETAHFGEGEMQWPVHCVAETDGADFHQDFMLDGATQYKKGQEVLKKAEEDASYTGIHALDENGELLGEYVRRTKKTGAIVVGFVLGGKDFNTCVDSTAIDFAHKTNADVYVVRDATVAIKPEEIDAIEQKLRNQGVRIVDSQELLDGQAVQLG